MQLRYNFRRYPRPGQRVALAKAFGCARKVFNDAVAVRRAAHVAGQRFPSSAQLQKQLITVAKRTPERAYLAEVSHTMLQQAVRDCDQAYRNFFASLKGRRAGRKVNPPRFRSRKDTRQTIRYTGSDFAVKDSGRLRLARVGEVEVRWSRALPGKPSSVTILRDSAGRFFASFVVEPGLSKPPPETDAEIGIDLGLSAYATDSRGRTIVNPRFLRRAERRLRRAQKVLSRKEYGSHNRAKARVKVARLHARVRDTRRDWLHKQTTRLIRDNQAVYLENLAVAGLARTRMAKSVYDAAWGTFRRMLEEKAARCGRVVHVIGRFEPSSKRCSSCGGIKDMPLSLRVYECSACGLILDRDVNAALNILAAGRAERLNACGAQVRPAPVRAPCDEAGTHPGAPADRPKGRVGRAAGIPAPQGGEGVKLEYSWFIDVRHIGEVRRDDRRR